MLSYENVWNTDGVHFSFHAFGYTVNNQIYVCQSLMPKKLEIVSREKDVFDVHDILRKYTPTSKNGITQPLNDQYVQWLHWENILNTGFSNAE